MDREYILRHIDPVYLEGKNRDYYYEILGQYIREQERMGKRWEETWSKTPEKEREMWREIMSKISGSWKRRTKLWGLAYWVLWRKHVSFFHMLIYLTVVFLTVIYDAWDLTTTAFVFLLGGVSLLTFIPDLLGIGKRKFLKNPWWGWFVLILPLFFYVLWLTDPWDWNYLAMNNQFDDSTSFFLLGYVFYAIFFMLPTLGDSVEGDDMVDIKVNHLHKVAVRRLKRYRKKYGIDKPYIHGYLAEWFLREMAKEEFMGGLF